MPPPSRFSDLISPRPSFTETIPIADSRDILGSKSTVMDEHSSVKSEPGKAVSSEPTADTSGIQTKHPRTSTLSTLKNGQAATRHDRHVSFSPIAHDLFGSTDSISSGATPTHVIAQSPPWVGHLAANEDEDVKASKSRLSRFFSKSFSHWTPFYQSRSA